MGSHSIIHHFRRRPRLLLAFAVGAVVAALLPSSLRLTYRILVGWNIAVWGYLVLIAWVMATSDPARVRRIALQEDAGAISVLFIMSTAASLSIAVIVLELTTVKQVTGSLRMGHYLFTALTVVGAWLLIAAIYTFHYALLYYRSSAEKRALRFPEDDPEPDYWDFLYFSLTIAVAAQTSDISVMSRPMRKAVMAQSLLSFAFNVVIIGLTINISAGLLGT